MTPPYELFDDVVTWDIEDTALSPNENIRVWIDRWFESLMSAKVSKHTIKSYRDTVSIFLEWVKRYPNMPISKIGAKYINRFLIHYQIELARKKYENGKLDEEKYALLLKEASQRSIGHNDAGFTILPEFENTLQQRLTIVKILLKYITENNYQQVSYTSVFPKIKQIKIGNKNTDFFMPDELEKLDAFMRKWVVSYRDHFPRSNERYAYRNAFLLILAVYTGARGNEILHIRLSDIEVRGKGNKRYALVRIGETKGSKKERNIRLPYSKIRAFHEYFTGVLPDDTFYLSSTYKNDAYTNSPMDINVFRRFSNFVFDYIGIKKRGLHAIRRGYVTKRVAIDKESAANVAKEVGNTTEILESHYLKYAELLKEGF